MIPAQLVRSLGTAARLTGQAGRQAQLVALEEGVTLEDVLELLEHVLDAVDRARPTAERTASPRRSGRGGQNSIPPDVEDQVVALLRAGRTPDQISAVAGVAARTVRRIRARAGIAPPSRKRTGPPRWEAPIREAHRRRLTVAEIVVETGYRESSVRQYLSMLRLRAHPARNPVVLSNDD